MVSSMANWCFILVFCKRLGCLQPLSKIFKPSKFFFLILRERRPHGWDGRHWEGKTGIEDLKDERRWHLLKDEEELSLEYECIIQLKLCI